MPLLQIQSGALAFGHVPLLDDIDLVIEKRERLCLIGRNGTGKSTLLNVISGSQALDGGALWRQDGLRTAKLAQEVPDAAQATLFDVVAAGLGDHGVLLGSYHAASLALADGGEAAMQRFSRIQAEVEAADAWAGSERVDATLSRLALPPDALLSECSGGIRRRAMLGQALVSEPDLLLLDEPTNHLDIESIEALETALLSYPGAVLFISHDRSLIDALATRIIELDRGVLRSFPGNYAQYLKRKSALLDAEADAERKFDQTLAQEEAWIRQGIKARRTRNEGRVRRLEALRLERAARRTAPGKANMLADRGEQSGKLVIEAIDVSYARGQSQIIAPTSINILRGDRIGVIGPNGSGKTTLLRLLLGQLEPTNGDIRMGTRLQTAYFDQEREQLDPERSVIDNVADGADRVQIGDRSRHVISYLGDFLFSPARVRSPVKTLSGGERNRLLLARLFARPSNLLVLDEPTNDLDIETLELLEALLCEYDGTLLLVSHDRSFLDRTVTSTLAIDPQGRVSEHLGGYSDWQRAQRKTHAARVDPNQNSSGDSAGTPRRKSKTRKLDYLTQRELIELPARIEALEAQLAQQQQSTSEPSFYQREQSEVSRLLRAMGETEAALDAAYARWQALEALADPSQNRPD